MKAYSPSDVRVVGFLGHRGSGKTSLVEGILFNAKATTRLGRVEDGTLTLELDEEAKGRQMTMHANVGFCEWNGIRVHIIDTPGDGNFWGAANRCLSVIDGAVVTVSAPDGVEPITTRAIQGLQLKKTPFAIFVTKLDKEGSDFEATLEEIKGDVEGDAAVLSLPIGKGPAFKGVVSLLSQKAYVPDGDTTKEVDPPADMAGEISAAREQLFDAVAAADDDLAERYLEEGTLTEEELSKGLKAAFLRGQLVPVLAGNPTANVGSRVLLDVIRAVFPSPVDRPVIKGYKSEKRDNPLERQPDANGPLVAQVFRTFYDPFAGMLSYARIWSGKITAGGDVYNVNRSTGDRPSHIFLPQGGTKGGAELKEGTIGDILALTKLKSTSTGDTLSDKADPTFLEPFEEPEALLNYGISAADKKAEDKMAQTVSRLVEEDPSLRFERDPSSGETILGGLGQAHVDYVIARLKHQGIDVTLKEPKVPYKETLRLPIKDIEGKHKKQSGGSGQFGVCYIHVEPLPRGSGIEFSDQIVGGTIPRNYIPSVEKGVRDALTKGPISGSEVVDLKVSLYDGKYHKVDSSDVAFQIAGRKAIRAAFASKNAKPVLLEPYMEIEVTCPAENVGDVMGDLNSRRARVSNMTTEGKRGKVSAVVPMNEVLKYTNALKSITSGRGSFTMKFGHYEEAPTDVQQSVAAAYKADEDED